MKVLHVQRTANVGAIDTGGGIILETPFDRDNDCYEVEIEHEGKHAFFYLFGGASLPLEEWALARLAWEEYWANFEQFKAEQVYPGGMTEETARKLYNYQKDTSERLFALLGEEEYEAFMQEYGK